MKSYADIKRKKRDYCNICGELSDLTWDHVPPQSCYNDFPVKFNRFTEGLPQYNKYDMISQNGTRFRSLCSKCNNTLLGRDYDLELGNFINAVLQHISKSIEATDEKEIVEISNIQIEVKVNKVVRSICGHVLAAKDEYDNLNLVDRALREFFLNPEECPPNSLSLLLWFYPYTTISIMRDFAVANVLDRQRAPLPVGLCSVVSAFPFSYVLCDKGYAGSLINLFDYCTHDIDEKVMIPINFSSCFSECGILRNPLWPCNISDEPDGTDLILTSKFTTESSALGVRKIALHDMK